MDFETLIVVLISFRLEWLLLPTDIELRPPGRYGAATAKGEGKYIN